MDTDKYRSTNVPIDVTVESDRETVKCGGAYSAVDGGFVIAFESGDGKYEITHTDEDTVLSVSGLLSYKISFAASSSVSVDTPFGAMTVSVEPISCAVDMGGEAIVIVLKYSVDTDGIRQERDIKVTARLK